MAEKRNRGRAFDVARLAALLADSGLWLTIYDVMYKQRIRFGYRTKDVEWDRKNELESCRKVLATARAGEAVDKRSIRVILTALGVYDDPACFEDYLQPDRGAVAPAARAFDYDWAAYQVSVWSGQPADWMAGGHAHPLDELGWAVKRARTDSDRAAFLLLLTHAAVKLGASGQRRLRASGQTGPLVALAKADRSVYGAAATYLLGRLATTQSATATENGQQARYAKEAYAYWERINPEPTDKPLLLPGLANETDEWEQSSLDVEPFARFVPRPHRYLSAAAIRIAWHAILDGDAGIAEDYLAKSLQHIEDAGPTQASWGRRLNLRLNRIATEVIQTNFRVRARARIATSLLDQIEVIRHDVQAAFQQGELPRWKHAEWQLNLTFAGFAVRSRGGESPAFDALVENLHSTRQTIGAERLYIVRFDPIYAFATQGVPDLADALDCLTAPPLVG